MYSDDYSSVTSADIDNALSGDDDDDDKDGGGDTTTTGSDDRHVTFVREGVISADVGVADERRSCFQRGALERRTLPPTPSGSSPFLRPDMKTSGTVADLSSEKSLLFILLIYYHYDIYYHANELEKQPLGVLTRCT